MIPHGIAAKALRDQYAYDAETGTFTWKKDLWGSGEKAPARIGDLAGRRKGTEVILTMHGYELSARRVAWLFMTGAWPEERVRMRDGNPRNLAWNNLALSSTLAAETVARRAAAQIAKQRAVRDAMVCDDCAAPILVGKLCAACRKIRARWTRIAKRYELSAHDFAELLKSQDYACAICEEAPESGPMVDHDHVTGRVRAILCSACNTGLGHFRDRPDLLAKAAAYLAA